MPVDVTLISYIYTIPLESVKQMRPSSSSNIPYTGSIGESCNSSKGVILRSDTNRSNPLVFISLRSINSFNELKENVELTGVLNGLLLGCNS